MVIDLQQLTEHRALEIRLVGERPESHAATFLRHVERRVDQEGNFRVLMHLDNFEPRNEELAWEEIKNGFKHFQDVSRVALVGDTPWHEKLGRLCKSFPHMASRFYTREELDAAQRWITSPA